MRSAAYFYYIGIADNHRNGFDRHTQPLGSDLGETCLVPLAAWLGPDDEIHVPVGPDVDFCLLTGRANR